MSDEPRDCKHGQQARACNVCELEGELLRVTKELEKLQARLDVTDMERSMWRTRCKEAQRCLGILMNPSWEWTPAGIAARDAGKDE